MFLAGDHAMRSTATVDRFVLWHIVGLCGLVCLIAAGAQLDGIGAQADYNPLGSMVPAHPSDDGKFILGWASPYLIATTRPSGQCSHGSAVRDTLRLLVAIVIGACTLWGAMDLLSRCTGTDWPL